MSTNQVVEEEEEEVISPLKTVGKVIVEHKHRALYDPEGYVFPSSKLQECPPGRKPIVLLACGSFSPITYMHLRMLEMGRDAINKGSTDEYVIGGFISPVSDAYGKQGLAPAAHRLAMCELAVKSSTWISIDSWEALQPKYRYTIEVINHLIQSVNKNVPESHPRIGVKLVCGSDLLDSFCIPGVWALKDIEDICSNGIVCLEREGTDTAMVISRNDLLSKYKNNITIVKQHIRNDISSTSIRQCIKQGLSIKYLLPDEVEAYIYKHKLFV